MCVCGYYFFRGYFLTLLPAKYPIIMAYIIANIVNRFLNNLFSINLKVIFYNIQDSFTCCLNDDEKKKKYKSKKALLLKIIYFLIE